MTPAHAKGIALRFKIRASAAAKIMANGRGTDTIGETCMNFCKNWILSQPEFYGIDVNKFSSKYTSKGNAVEKDALDYIGVQLYNGLFLEPNTDNFSDNHMTGTPDIIMDDHLIDNKSSWSIKTFPFFVTKPDPDYVWQAQVYMHLTGRHKYKLIYTLMDTPEWMILQNAKTTARDLGYEEPTKEMVTESIVEMSYSHLPENLRMKIFEIDFDPTAIERLRKRVEDCREFIENTLLTMEI